MRRPRLWRLVRSWEIPWSAVFGLVALASSVVTILQALGVSLVVPHDRRLATVETVLVLLAAVPGASVAVSRYRMQATELNELQRILHGFGNEIRRKQTEKYFTITEWREIVEIDGNGDGVIRAWITIRTGKRPVSSFWQLRGYSGDPERVKVKVYQLGPGGGHGIKCPTTREWRGGTLITYVLFEREAPPNTDVQLIFEFVWPRLGKSFIGSSEEVMWKFTRKVRSLHHEIKFSAALKLDERFAILPFSADHPPIVTRFPSGEIIVTFDHENPNVGQEIGYRLGVAPP